MTDKRENIRIVNCDFLFIAFIVFFGLLSNNGSSIPESDDNSGKPVTTYLALSEIYAVSNPEIQLPLIQKAWTSVKDNFYPADSSRNPVAENKISDLKISLFQIIRYNISSTQLISSIYLFTSEKDDPFHLS
jgi:hypothetical protein